MSAIKLIGRTNDFKGKTLWEIVGNLRDFGVGRYVKRSMFERYPEPSFMKIVRVQAMPLPEKGDRKVKVWVEKTFRGRACPKLVEICSTSYKADYQLIPKADEPKYCRSETVADEQKRILPQTIELPPLLREFIAKETGNESPTLKIKIKANREKIARVAQDGEVPTIALTIGLGQPASLRLYKGLNL